MKIKIVDTFPTAKIYIDDKEIERVAKYKVKRSVGNLPVVVLTVNPLFIEMDLTKSVKLNHMTYLIWKIKYALNRISKLIKQKCSYKKSKSKKD